MSRRELELPAPQRPVFNGVERRRVQAWFEETADVQVRLVCGPIGAGKTIAVRQFVDRNPARAVYVRVMPRAEGGWLATALEAAPRDAILVLDDIDRAEAAAYADMTDAIVAGELRRKLILVGRSRRRLRADALIARGLARACSAAALSFDAEELERLAASQGMACAADDLAQLLHDTEGWPIAADWLIREAAEKRRTLRDAFTHWRADNGHLLLEFVENEGAQDAAAFTAFRDGLGLEWANAQHDAERLEQLGLPIVRTRSGLRPYRILSRLAVPASQGVVFEPTTTVQALMIVNAFGRFRCEIAGRPVAFSRRRDQQVFTYVALAPECRTSRDMLLDAFWPDINRTVATQGLRTTLSRVRRAIAETVPGIDPERYFETGGSEIRVNTRTVAVDVHRFVDHVEQGRLDDARGSIEGAKHHYRVAQRIYADRLLASEAPEACFELRAENFEALYIEVLARITEIHAATGDFEIAREAARGLLARNNEEARRRALRSIAIEPAASA